jgi:hypothetical protein
VFLLAGMTCEASLRRLFRRFILERNDLCRISLLYVGPAGTVARLTTGNFRFPAADCAEFGVRGMRERLELIFVAFFAGLASDVVLWVVVCFGLASLDGFRWTAGREPCESGNQRKADEQGLDDFVGFQLCPHGNAAEGQPRLGKPREERLACSIL